MMLFRNERDEKMENYFKIIKNCGLWNSRINLQNYFNHLFHNISFQGKNVLDIGGGSGLISFYAALRGAENVVCLEPEGAGSTTGVVKCFKKIKSELKIKNVSLKNLTIQNFNSKKDSFDLILLHNSINHLDEKSCIALDQDSDAKKSYNLIFDKLFQLAKSNAKIIMVDCSNTNLFNIIHLKNLFSPDIEWKKHQKPQLWTKLMMSSGFVNPTIHWMSFLGFNRPQFFFNNKLISLTTTSHFLLIAKKP